MIDRLIFLSLYRLHPMGYCPLLIHSLLFVYGCFISQSLFSHCVVCAGFSRSLFRQAVLVHSVALLGNLVLRFLI